MPFAQPITFSDGGATLDRAQHLRAGSHALLDGANARLLAISGGRLLTDITADVPRLGWIHPSGGALGHATEAPVFLGLLGGAPCFAATWPEHSGDGPDTRIPEGMKFIDLRSIAGQLSTAEATVAATAKGVLGWHETHRFCARCGAASDPDEGGWRRRCPACGGLHFPRTDPVVIMLIVRGERCLLGRQSSWPQGLYSCLAGFMEPGETIEDAVRREVEEESRISVGRVRYLACQPWPFPASLMLGCVGEALSEAITIDETEIEDARWVERTQIRRMLAGEDGELASPRVDAIARALLQAWVDGQVESF